MALTDDDLKKIGSVVRDNIAEALEDVVYPRLIEMESGLTNEIKASEGRLDNRMDGVESSLGKSIDNLAKAVTENHASHEKRIVRLETRIGLTAD